MRVVFMGTPGFAVPPLTLLARCHEVAAVLTRPDAVRGRGKGLVASPVKERAGELGIPVIDCARVTPEIIDAVRALSPDVACVAAFGCILPPALLETPRLGCVNVHASLLPRWRGAAPIERAILAGDEETGVSIMAMEEGLDTGPVAWQASVPCAGRSQEELTRDLAFTGAYGLLDVLELMDSGEARWMPQGDGPSTYAERIRKGELDLSPELAAEGNLRHVLASDDAHPARLLLGTTLVRVRRAQLAETPVAPAHLEFRDGKALLGCVDGALELLEVTPAGKKPMDAPSWMRGLHGRELLWEKP